MLATVEARWFQAGIVPGPVQQWFQRGEPAWNSGRRTDQYLILRTEALSIKLREARFEIKRRDTEIGVVNLGERVAGRLELWRKWSFPIGENPADRPDQHWVSVSKGRQLRKYRVDGARQVIPVAPNSFPDRGCTFELTSLEVRGEPWWSLGFEAFGLVEAELQETLEWVTAHCFGAGDHPTLEAQNSWAYPEWLARWHCT